MTDAASLNGSADYRDIAARLPGWLTELIENEDIEELALFGRQIAEDRISDIACNVLKSYFIDYTREIVERHGRNIGGMVGNRGLPDVNEC